jgi:hypothetical protein
LKEIGRALLKALVREVNDPPHVALNSACLLRLLIHPLLSVLLESLALVFVVLLLLKGGCRESGCHAVLSRKVRWRQPEQIRLVYVASCLDQELERSCVGPASIRHPPTSSSSIEILESARMIP